MADTAPESTTMKGREPTPGAGERPSITMVPLPPVGRRFSGERRVRLGDVDPSGRLRLDALTRYTQDVSNDDTRDVALPDDMAWVVRTTTVDVHQSASFGEQLTFITFCGRLGKRWAERRLVVTGEQGARYEVATLWVHIDIDTGRPLPLSDAFMEHYAEAAMGQTVRAKQTIPRPDAVDVAVDRTAWPLRSVDFDTFDHVNNAAYWAVVEESLAGRPIVEPCRATIEYGAGIGRNDAVEIFEAENGSERLLWFDVDGQVVASASVAPLSPSVPTGANTQVR